MDARVASWSSAAGAVLVPSCTRIHIDSDGRISRDS